MKNIAIIPARGTSKRLPRKNILPILGRPMLSYPLTAAFNCNLFDKIVVSTEDEEIASIALGLNAEVIMRPPELNQYHATVIDVCLHSIDYMNKREFVYDNFCCIYATALFVQPEDLIESYNILISPPKGDVVMGVSPFNAHPVLSLIEKKNGYLDRMWPEYLNKKPQAYPHLVASNGTIYWAKVSEFCKSKAFYCSKLKKYQMPKSRVVDIDTPDDYNIAKIFAKYYFFNENN